MGNHCVAGVSFEEQGAGGRAWGQRGKLEGSLRRTTEWEKTVGKEVVDHHNRKRGRESLKPCFEDGETKKNQKGVGSSKKLKRPRGGKTGKDFVRKGGSGLPTAQHNGEIRIVRMKGEGWRWKRKV